METKERSIRFTAEEVLATLAGQKTQFRRVIEPQPVGTGPGGEPKPIVAAYRIGGGWDFQSADGATQQILACPFGKVGERLWVQETWQVTSDPTAPYSGLRIEYRAGGNGRYLEFAEFEQARKWVAESAPWRSSVHMPRWASRILLEITGIRLERVQEISEADVLAEGVQRQHIQKNRGFFHANDVHGLAFGEAWDRLNAKPKPSNRNPYTQQPEKCKVAYPFDGERAVGTISRKASPWHGCKVYVVGNPWVFAGEFKQLFGNQG